MRTERQAAAIKMELESEPCSNEGKSSIYPRPCEPADNGLLSSTRSLAEPAQLSADCRRIADNIRNHTRELGQIPQAQRVRENLKTSLERGLKEIGEAIRILEIETAPRPGYGDMTGKVAEVAASVSRVRTLRAIGILGQVAAIPADANAERVKFEALKQLQLARSRESTAKQKLADVEKDIEAADARHAELTELLHQDGLAADKHGCDNRVLVWGG